MMSNMFRLFHLTFAFILLGAMASPVVAKQNKKTLKGIKAFEKIAHLNPPKHVVNLLLEAHDRKFFKEVVFFSKYGLSKTKLIFHIFGLSCLLIFLGMNGFSIGKKAYSAQVRAQEQQMQNEQNKLRFSILATIAGLIIMTIHYIKRKRRAYYFDGYIFITDTGKLSIEQGKPEVFRFMFYEDMSCSDYFLIKKSGYFRQEIVPSLRIGDRMGVVKEYTLWEKPASYLKKIGAFVKEKVAEKNQGQGNLKISIKK